MTTLSITESDEQIIYGIPYYLSATTDDGYIYYTLDGSTPSENSLLADNPSGDTKKIYLPTNDSNFTIKIVSISEGGSSEVYEKEFTATYGSVKNSRKGNEGGVVVMTESAEVVDSMGFDSLGSPSKESSIDLSSLDIKASVPNGQGISDGFSDSSKTYLDFINFANTDDEYYNNFKVSYVNDNVNFDPKSKVIVINARNESEINSQSVVLINRSYGTFDPSSNFYVENEENFKQIISGNFVRAVYNNVTGAYTSYYYESKESKWIISNQVIDKKNLNLMNTRVRNFTYKWIKDPVMSKIF